MTTLRNMFFTRSRHRWQLFIGAGLLLFIVIGLVVGMVVLRHQQNIQNKAFSGYTADLATLQRTIASSTSAADPLKNTVINSNSQTPQTLFITLLHVYPRRDQQTITIPSLNINGVVFSAFDPQLNKTFVFARIENLPVPNGAFVRMWLQKKDTTIYASGIGQMVHESQQPVVYVVGSLDGNAKDTYAQAILSFDTQVNVSLPEAPVITVNF